MAEEKVKKSVADKVKEKFDRAEKIFLISNVLMTLIFAANSVLNMVSDFGAGPIQYVTLALLGAYVIAFVVLIVLFNKDKSHLKENMTNYKFAIKVMKNVVNLMNLAISISVMIEALTIDSGGKKIYALIVAFIGIFMAVFKFIRLIVKFIFKKKKAARKAEKKALKAEQKVAKTNARNAKINKVKKVLNLADESQEVTATDDTVDTDSNK